MSADLVAKGDNPLPLGGNQNPVLWIWATSDKRKPYAAVFCRHVDHPLLAMGEWPNSVEEITEEDNPDLFNLARANSGLQLKVRRDKEGRWEIIE